MNGKHEEGAVKGLREDCACPIAKIIICNYLPKATRIAALTQDEGHTKKGGSHGQRKALGSHPCSHSKTLRSFCAMKKQF